MSTEDDRDKNSVLSVVDARASLDEMWDVCAAIAFETETTQAVLVKSGMQDGMSVDALRRARVLTQICRFLEVVKEVEPQLREMIVRKRGLQRKQQSEEKHQQFGG